MRVLFALPGLHRYDRGAEIAFIAIATELAKTGHAVTLIGSGEQRPAAPYRFLRAASVRRERFEAFPSIPFLRGEYSYEDLTFLPTLLLQYRPSDYDVTITCNFPFCNLALRRPVLGGKRPPHVYVTQNGDWPAQSNDSEYRFFGCEGLICTNPDFYERNRKRWPSALIPNGVAIERFASAMANRNAFNLPAGRLIVLMVSALIPSKRVDVGIEAVAGIPNAHLVVAGDGPSRAEIEAKASALPPGRFTRLSVTPDKMPALYHSADVFLHLSLDESFGNVFLEAMACGLPVVAQDSERSRWIVGDDEFLADTTDVRAVTRRIEEAFAKADEGRQRRAMKASAFAWPNIAGKYETFLQEIVGQSKYHG